METIEIARKLAGLGQSREACRAYALAIQRGAEPQEQLEAAAYILQSGGDYKISYTAFLDLYNRGFFREDILPLMNAVFYEPNVKLLKSRYDRNCKRLAKYSYLFRKDFVPFEDLPIQFFPYDDHNGYVPFYKEEGRFGEFVNFGEPVVRHSFFTDLEKPILGTDVFSQYELEYLCDNVRRSEDIGRENHVYLHYTDWAVFCAHLQCLNLRLPLEGKKLVFLIEDEVEQYPIDFKARFGIDYSQYPVKPIGIREVNRLIWHTQLSTHNGGDFFNEVFDAHPNLVFMPSVMMHSVTKLVNSAREVFDTVKSLKEAQQTIVDWPAYLTEELYHMRDRTDKDYVVAIFLGMKDATEFMDPSARIVPAFFFQPHFYNIVYSLRVDEETRRTVLEAANYEEIRHSPIFKNFKYIKTFTPMRRFTTSHGATVRFMYQSAQEPAEEEGKQNVVSDAVMERIMNRSFMIDPEDRLYKDSVLVRLEDGKLNPKATFTALTKFLDLPYTESMAYCSENGRPSYYAREQSGNGFNPASIYRTYDDFANDDERYFIEYFLRDAYEFYGYGFQYYDGAPMDEEKAAQLIKGFTTVNHYMRETWMKIFMGMQVSQDGEPVHEDLARAIQEKLLDDYMADFDKNRLNNARILLKGLHFVNGNGQPLRMMPMLELDPELLEAPIYH